MAEITDARGLLLKGVHLIISQSLTTILHVFTVTYSKTSHSILLSFNFPTSIGLLGVCASSGHMAVQSSLKRVIISYNYDD